MSAPKTVVAVWNADYTQLYLLVAISSLFAFGLVILPVMRRWRAKQSLAKKTMEPSKNCPVCGKPASLIPKINKYYCSDCKRYI
jgi:hypothetical protein